MPARSGRDCEDRRPSVKKNKADGVYERKGTLKDKVIKGRRRFKGLGRNI